MELYVLNDRRHDSIVIFQINSDVICKKNVTQTLLRRSALLCNCNKMKFFVLIAALALTSVKGVEVSILFLIPGKVSTLSEKQMNRMPKINGEVARLMPPCTPHVSLPLQIYPAVIIIISISQL